MIYRSICFPVPHWSWALGHDWWDKNLLANRWADELSFLHKDASRKDRMKNLITWEELKVEPQAIIVRPLDTAGPCPHRPCQLLPGADLREKKFSKCLFYRHSNHIISWSSWGDKLFRRISKIKFCIFLGTEFFFFLLTASTFQQCWF